MGLKKQALDAAARVNALASSRFPDRQYEGLKGMLRDIIAESKTVGT